MASIFSRRLGRLWMNMLLLLSPYGGCHRRQSDEEDQSGMCPEIHSTHLPVSLQHPATIPR